MYVYVAEFIYACTYYKDISMIASLKKKTKKNDSYLTLYKNQESVFNKSHLVYLILRNVTLLLFNS